MAGHSKWANIRFRKERADAKKGKIFSRIAKEITSAVKQGGCDPKTNPKLARVLQKARSANYPNDNIDRLIKNAMDNDQGDYDEVVYELYGHGGVGIIVEAMTDNKNRMASEIRIATNKRGGTIASPGSVAYNFDKKGVIQVSKEQVDEEKLFALAIEAGAQDFEENEESFIITTDPKDLYQVKEAIESRGIKCQDASLDMLPKTYIECDKEQSDANLALIEWLEAIDDVDEVYHNMRLFQ